MSGDRPVDVAARLVRERFPGVLAAFLGGSSVTGRRTPWSDLDIVVVLDGPPAPFRETLRFEGWVVELFVQTETSIEYYWGSDAERRRTPLLRMVADGVILAGGDGAATAFQERAAALLAAGPVAPDAATIDYQRYLLTDLVDDLRGCTEPVELAYLAATLMLAASDFLLLAENRWSARGKWLPRRIGEVDPDLPGRLAAGQRAVAVDGDREPLIAAVLAVLDFAGGPLQEGFVLSGKDPGRNAE
ncbi:nucleotidyltransferase domain-containing protein [Actinoplanes flavus]|uniref:Nucleotidyltransferase domain-containing protein n=1 Tax=Actinoplanes flavus TaxID=2820290 RepID=A0ABS3UKT1_9ACTN|nr:nucleotidyltransferase domain-containing protein [Actinoplanes flavus]MBO3739392.1 nucleotidyltransferase domain-containing protein [Actinoplanes flavus]